jgi:hypothetical protein
MGQMRRLSVLTLATLCVALPAAPATAKLSIGISDQTPHFFADKYFAPLKIKRARLVVPYNIMTRKDYWVDYLQFWLDEAKRTGVEPHIAFGIAGVEDKYLGKGPKPRQYKTMIRQFRKKYPQVRTFTPWNEVNHSFQPTAKRPRLAYQYYRALNSVCPQCKVLAADVLDDANMESWLRKFKRYYKGTGTWGIHNYQDANKRRSFRSSFTYKITKLVKGQIWSTEAGGIVGFKTIKGKVGYKYSLKRQLRAQRYLFKLMSHRKVRLRYQRVYIYHYFGSWSKNGKKTNRWDSGLLGPNGKPRPAYYDLKKRTT